MALSWWLHALNEAAVSILLNNLGASLRGEAEASESTTLGIPQGVWQPSIETGTIQIASCAAKTHRT